MGRLCPDCDAPPGHVHRDGCDVERCPDCGGQYFACGCPDSKRPRLVWTGRWPGTAEAEEFGWWCKMMPGHGWVPCAKDDEGATEDMNRLYIEAVWNPESARFELPATKEPTP
jgi:hypothetical protein